MNPALPLGFELAFICVAIFSMALTLTALVSMTRRRRGLTSLARLAWIVAIVALPVAASLAWFAVGPGLTRSEDDANRL